MGEVCGCAMGVCVEVRDTWVGLRVEVGDAWVITHPT